MNVKAVDSIPNNQLEGRLSAVYTSIGRLLNKYGDDARLVIKCSDAAWWIEVHHEREENKFERMNRLRYELKERTALRILLKKFPDEGMAFKMETKPTHAAVPKAKPNSITAKLNGKAAAERLENKPKRAKPRYTKIVRRRTLVG